MARMTEGSSILPMTSIAPRQLRQLNVWPPITITARQNMVVLKVKMSVLYYIERRVIGVTGPAVPDPVS